MDRVKMASLVTKFQVKVETFTDLPHDSYRENQCGSGQKKYQTLQNGPSEWVNTIEYKRRCESADIFHHRDESEHFS